MIKELLEKESIAKIIFAYSNEGIMVTFEDGKIAYANPKALEMFGYEYGQLIDKKVEILLPDNLKDKHIHYRKEFAQNPSNRAMGEGRHLLGKTFDGNTFPIEISLSPFNYENENYVLCFISNISKRKEQEDKLNETVKALDFSSRELQRLNKDLEDKVAERTIELADTIKKLKQSQNETEKALEKEKELNSLKSKFISTASHEFRTPLATILTSVSLIKNYANNDEKREKHYTRIASSVGYLTKILDDLLTIEKTEDSQIQFSKEDVELVDCIDQIIEDLKENLKENQQIIFEHQEKINLKINEYLLRSVITNLLNNALKYSGEGSNIVIKSKKQRGNILIEVKDNGIGIPEEDQNHIFERFYRSNNTAATQGTGLGLYIVKKNTELLAGEITFESELNKGTTFLLTLKDY